MSFSKLIDLYSVEGVSVRFHHVDGSLLRPFADLIEAYRIELQKTYENNESLLELYNLYRRLFWRLLSSFSPYKTIISEDIQQQIFRQCHRIRESYPAFFEKYVLPLLKEMKTLLEIDDNELKSFVCEHINSIAEIGHRIAIVTKRAIPIEEKSVLHYTLRDIFKVSYYTENSFRNAIDTYHFIFIIGNPSYFSDAVKTIFKSKNVTFISYDFFENAIYPKKVFKELSDKDSFSTVYKEITVNKTLEQRKKLTIDQKEEASIFINEFIKSQGQKKVQNHELISASIFHLENNRFLFAPKESKIRIYNPYSKKHIVEQASSSDVKDDDYIIIRNDRDISLIADVADRYILKENAKSYRNMQHRWKKKLRKNVEIKGFNTVSKILTDRYAIKTASVASVRNWCDDDSICPIELDKILKAFKYSAIEIKEVCRAMKVTQSAHREAGRIISKKLMSELSDHSLKNLEENGYYTFESTEFDGASFNIERVVSIDTSEYLIAHHNLMKIINMN